MGRGVLGGQDPRVHLVLGFGAWHSGQWRLQSPSQADNTNLTLTEENISFLTARLFSRFVLVLRHSPGDQHRAFLGLPNTVKQLKQAAFENDTQYTCFQTQLDLPALNSPLSYFYFYFWSLQFSMPHFAQP